MKYQTYTKYKLSGVEWLKDIPIEWKRWKIKNVLKELSGNGFPESEQGSDTKEVPFYKVSDINGKEKFVDEANNFVLKKTIATYKWNVIPRGSLIAPKIGEALRKNHRKITSVNCVIDNNCIAFRCININSNFNYYLFKLIDFEWFANPGTVPSLSVEKLKSSKIYLPDIKDQQKIADFLDKKTKQIDDLIKKDKQLIELLKEKRIALINKAVTKGLDDKIKLVDSGVDWVGKIPEGWKMEKLKNIVSVKITDGPHETPEFLDSGVPFISAEAIKNNKINFDLIRGFISAEEHRRFCSKCKPKKYDIFLIKSGATTGNVAMVETDNEFSIWSPLALIRVENKVFIPKLMFYNLQSYYFKKQIELSWSFGTQENIGMGVIQNLLVSAPPVETQEKIVDCLDNEVDKINKHTKKVIDRIKLLEEYKKSLIYNAVTGKIKV